MTVLTKEKAIGEIVVNEYDTRITRKTFEVQTGQDLSLGDVCEPGTDATEKRLVTVAANEVQAIVFGGTPTGGTFVLWTESLDGVMVPTTALAYNASAATISTALDAANGETAGIVATGTTLPDQTITFTYSGTNYAAKGWSEVVADISLLTGGTPTAVESTTTNGHASGGLADSICLVNAEPIDEVQSIVFGGTPTGGTFTLTVLKQDTGATKATTALAYNASAATISTALDVATGNTADIVCTGTTLPDQTLTFTYSGGEYAGRTHRIIAADTALLTGGTPTAVESRTTAGQQRESVFLVGGPSIVDKDQLDYNSTTESVVDAALLALGINNQEEPTYTTQTT